MMKKIIIIAFLGLVFCNYDVPCEFLTMNLFIPHMMDKQNREKIFSFAEKINGIKEAREFLLMTHQKLDELVKKDKEDHGVISYYDIFDEKLHFFDSTAFNSLVTKLYFNKLQTKLEYNIIYRNISFFISFVSMKYQFPFFSETTTLFDIECFFFKNLRSIMLRGNIFNINRFLNNVNTEFFESFVKRENIELFFREIFEVLLTNNIIFFVNKNGDFKFKPEYYYDLNRLIYCSFSPILFGYGYDVNYYIDSTEFEKIEFLYDKFGFEEKLKWDDIIFFYILISTTNSIIINKKLNNCLYDIM